MGPIAAADEPTPPKTLLAERRKLVLQDDFSQPLDKAWQISAPIWEIEDGVIKATHRKPFPDLHGPVMQHPVKLDGAVVQLSFKLEPKTRAVIHFNKKNGHLCRALMTDKAFYIIRRDSGGDKGIRLDEREMPIEPGQWHTVIVEIVGKEMLATLDGKEVLFGERDDIDQPKTMLILEAAAGSVWFKDLRVWEAQPNPNWAATKAKLIQARKPAANSP